MKIYNKLRAVSLFLVVAAFFLQDQIDAISSPLDKIDCMVDFGYPVSQAQSARNDLSQAVYALQQNDIDLVATMLQNALVKIVSRKSVDDRKALDDDDLAYIQAMIKEIDNLIAQLENKEKAILITELCQQLQDIA